MFYLLAFLILIVSWWLPWWIFAPLSFLAGRFSKSHTQAVLAGFLGVGMSWLMAIYYLDLKSFGRIGLHLAGLFSLPNSFIMILINALLGGVIGAIFSVAGYFWRPKNSVSAIETRL